MARQQFNEPRRAAQRNDKHPGGHGVERTGMSGFFDAEEPAAFRRRHKARQTGGLIQNYKACHGAPQSSNTRAASSIR